MEITSWICCFILTKGQWTLIVVFSGLFARFIANRVCKTKCFGIADRDNKNKTVYYGLVSAWHISGAHTGNHTAPKV